MLKRINKNHNNIFVERPILTDSHNSLTRIQMYLCGTYIVHVYYAREPGIGSRRCGVEKVRGWVV